MIVLYNRIYIVIFIYYKLYEIIEKIPFFDKSGITTKIILAWGCLKHPSPQNTK